MRDMVEKLNANDIEIITDFLPDETYNHLTLAFLPDFNGASSDARREAEAPGSKKPNVVY
jgi:hypothetical protein